MLALFKEADIDWARLSNLSRIQLSLVDILT